MGDKQDNNELLKSLSPMDKRALVKGILVECPLGAPLRSCPANKVRSLPVPELARLVNEMDELQLDGLIDYHCSCMKQRLEQMGRIGKKKKV